MKNMFACNFMKRATLLLLVVCLCAVGVHAQKKGVKDYLKIPENFSWKNNVQEPVKRSVKKIDKLLWWKDPNRPKYKKHKVYSDGKKIVWWEVKYPDGSVGISLKKKKNVLVPAERGYTAVSYGKYTKVFEVKKGDYCGAVNVEGKEIVAPVKYTKLSSEIKYLYPNDYICFIVAVNDKYGVLNRAGKEILACKYSGVSGPNTPSYDSEFLYFELEQKKQGKKQIALCDTAGKIFLPFTECNSLSPRVSIKKDVANTKAGIIGYLTYKDSKWGALDKNGKVVLPISYENVQLTDEHGALSVEFKKDGKWGVANSKGKIIIKPKYDDIYTTSDDGIKYFRVEKDGKHGVCNEKGVEIIPAIYNEMVFLSSGKYTTKIGSEYVKIDPGQFANPAKNIVKKNGKFVLSYKGEVFSARGYDALSWNSKKGVYQGTYKGYKTDIDRGGKEENSISSQMYAKAQKNTTGSVKERVALYKKVVDTDENNKEGYKAKAMNGIGDIYKNSGDTKTALEYYDKASAMGNYAAKSAAAQIRNAQTAAASAQRRQQTGSALSQFVNALAGVSSGNAAINNLFSYEGEVRKGQRDTNGRIISCEVNAPAPMGKAHYVWYTDGYCLSTTVTTCVFCHGRSTCYICNGQGRMYHAYFKNYQPCANCGATGRCLKCQGQGVSVSSKLSAPGEAAAYQQAKREVNSSSSSSSSSKSSSKSSSSNSKDYIDEIVYTPNYTGKDNNEWCDICKKVMSAHKHIKKRY